MKTISHQFGEGSSGFTLVEVLVSITVLGLMMVGVAQMLNSAALASSGSFKHLDADTQARMALDRIALDLSKISHRGDVDYYFAKNLTSTTPGNDQLAVFSESSGYYPSGVTGATQGSDLSLVGYRINSKNQLERLCKGLVWNGVATSAPSMVYGAPATAGTLINATWPNVEGSGTDADYQVIGDQIFRLEYCFLVSAPDYGALYTAPSSIPTSTTSYLTDVPYASPDTSPNGLQDVVAVVVSIAVLDADSQKIATTLNPSAMTTAAKDLDDVAASPSGSAIPVGSLPLTLWKADLAKNNLGLPKSVAGQVRFYQRYCYVNHAQ